MLCIGHAYVGGRTLTAARVPSIVTPRANTELLVKTYGPSLVSKSMSIIAVTFSLKNECRHRNSLLLLRGYVDALVLAVMFFPLGALRPPRLKHARLTRSGSGGGGGGARPSLMAVPEVWVFGARQWGTHWLTFSMWEPCTFRVRTHGGWKNGNGCGSGAPLAASVNIGWTLMACQVGLLYPRNAVGAMCAVPRWVPYHHRRYPTLHPLVLLFPQLSPALQLRVGLAYLLGLTALGWHYYGGNWRRAICFGAGNVVLGTALAAVTDLFHRRQFVALQRRQQEQQQQQRRQRNGAKGNKGE